MENDFYSILEIDYNSNVNDIKKAYRRLARKYHPDKNKDPDAINKFHQIQLAYETLINDETRRSYSQIRNKTKFQEFMDNIISNNLDIDGLKYFGLNLNQDECSKMENNFHNFIDKLNLKEIIDFFVNKNIPKKGNFDNDCSDSNINEFKSYDAYYYDSLPWKFSQHSSLTLRVSINVNFESLFKNEQRTIKIKRKIDNEFIITNFKFNIKNQYIIFVGGGDQQNGDAGDLIIRLVLDNKFLWIDNNIIIHQDISLYEYVYGVKINYNFGNMEICYDNWIPSRDGNDLYIKKIGDYNVMIKFILNYNDTTENKEILKNHFN